METQSWNGFIDTNSHRAFECPSWSELLKTGCIQSSTTIKLMTLTIHFLKNIYFHENIDSEWEINNFVVVSRQLLNI